MGFIKNLFSDQKHSQNNAIPSHESNQQQISKKEENEHLTSSLSDAMRFILDSHGESFLNEKAFVNMLVDYCFFVDKPFLKNILIGLQSNGITQKLLLCKNWDLESRNIIESYCYNFGVREEQARFLVKCIGFGLHKIESVEKIDTDIISKEQQEKKNPTPRIKSPELPTSKKSSPQSTPNVQYKFKTTKGVLLSSISPTGIIESEQFAYDESLCDVIIPEGVTSIKYGAFRNCVNLRKILIPSTVVEIGAMAFSECSKLEQIEFRGLPNLSVDFLDKNRGNFKITLIPQHYYKYNFLST